MGIQISLNNPAGPKQIENIFDRRVRQLMRMASIEFFRQVIIATPVDTGYARFGWFISTKTPSKYLPPPGDKFSVPGIEDHSQIEEFGINDKIYITNNVPYIGRLNDGYSKQAPARFVEMAATRVQNAVAQKAKTIK